jgi:chemotaxis protein methyltransferase CheR
MSAAVAYDRFDDYTVFCDGILALAKIDLSQYKRGQMERRLRTFAERRGIKSLV